MKKRTYSRIISFVLVLIMLVSMVPALNASAEAADASPAAASEYNTYAKYLESIKPENNYGLTDTVNEGKILQAWNWSYENAIALMETVAKQGFTTIQISPPNEIKMPTKGVAVCAQPAEDGIAPNGWWMLYQPAGFQINESEDNALGTKAQFIEMCSVAKEYGVKILVDAVVNHMGSDDDHIGLYENDSTDPMDHLTPRAAEFEPELLAAKAFHSPWKDMTYVESMGQAMRLYDSTGKPIPQLDGSGYPIKNALGYIQYQIGGSATEYDIEESLTQHAVSGSPDLATETQLVQNTIYDYLVELVESGADGFCFDAAKHIETVHDTYFLSDFWENTLLKLRAENPDKEIFAYGEIYNKCGDGRPFSEYTELMDVTDSSSFWGIKDAVCNIGNGGNPLPKYPNTNFTSENVIQWNESQDTYIDGGTSYFTIEQRNKIWALIAARQEITGVYFARPIDEPGNGRAEIEPKLYNVMLGEANLTSWTLPEVAAVNQFDNFFGDTPEFTSKPSKTAIVTRIGDAGVGATVVNLEGTTRELDVKEKNLPAGNYVDAITGNTFVAADGRLTGSIGSTGIAVLYYADDVAPVLPDAGTITDPWDIDVSDGQYPIVEGFNTVVFSTSWDSASIYCWSDSEGEMVSWPGTPMKHALVNEYGENQFVAYIPAEYDHYIINNNGQGKQTVNLYISESVGMYIDDKGADGKYTIGIWNPNFYAWAPATNPTTQPTYPTEPVQDSWVDGDFTFENKELGVTIIGYSGDYSEYVIIPEESMGLPVTAIASDVFADAQMLRVYIPTSITVIEDNAFTTTDAHIVYGGTSSQWKSITIGEGNDIVYYGTRHYNGAVQAYEQTMVEATCKEGGHTLNTCIYCDDNFKSDLTGIGDHSYEAEVTPPTCQQGGYTQYTCSVCGDFYTGDYIDPVDHNVVDGECTYCHQAFEIIESDHDYAPDTDTTWEISKPGADSITLTFSANTYVEQYYDFIFIYDANGKQIGRYTGSELAGVVIEVEGDYAEIRLTSDDGFEYYGFRAQVTATYPDASETYTIYFTKPADWADAYIFGFYVDNQEDWPVAYPGAKMNFFETNEYGQEVYTYEVPADIDFIEFNDGYTYKNKRTVEIPASDIADGRGYYISNSIDVSSSMWEVGYYDTIPEVPAPDNQATNVFLAGSFNSWSPTANEFQLTAPGAATSVVTLELAANTTYEFKVVRDGAWTTVKGFSSPITGSVSGLVFSSSGTGNATDGNTEFTTTVAGEYTFTWYKDTSVLDITYPATNGWMIDIDVSNGEYPVFDGYYTVVFTTKWASASMYCWSDSEGEMVSWPGTPMKHVLVNEYGENQFVAYIPAEYNNYIINNNGQGERTIELSISESVGMYMAEKQGDTYTIGTWHPVFYDWAPATNPTTQPTYPTEPEEKPESGIETGAGIFNGAGVGDKVRYTVELTAEELFEDFEAILTYDSEVLELAALYNEDGEPLTDMYEIGAAMCPNLYYPFVNANEKGIIKFFDVNLDGNDFSEGNMLITVDFIVKDTAYSELNFTIKEMSILGGGDNYFANGEAVVTDGISAVSSLEIIEQQIFTVVFLDYDGKFISVQTVKEGKGATAPDVPQRKGYTFAGWDRSFDFVTDNLVVYATYTKDAQPPVQAPTTGNLKIEVAGGKGFSISIDGGAYRAQGASYLNSQIKIGAQVTVKAAVVADSTFVGWVNPTTNTILSADLSYTFTASGNDFIKAMYVVKVSGVQMVTFKNDKSNRILEAQYYTSNESISFPQAPTQIGFDFAGWSMTEAEIQSAIAKGEDVTVLAKWTRQNIPVNVTVNGGTGTGTYNANAAVTVVANEAPAGQKFAYWTDAQGNIKSYSTSYTFYPAEDTTVTAVFVAEDTVIDYEVLVSVDSIDTVTVEGKNVFTYSWYCPDEFDFVKAGIIAVNKDNYNEATFYAGTSDSNVYDRNPSSDSNTSANTFAWTKSNVTSGQTWVAKAYVQYKDANGNMVTVYSDMMEATKD